MEVARASAAGYGFVQHGAAVHLFDILAEITDRDPLGHRDLALVGGFFAHDHAKERGLAGSVGADQTDFLAGIELKGSIHKDELLPVLLVNVRKRNHQAELSA